PGKDRQELLRQIAQEEPWPPQLLNPAVPAELATIALKALAKAPPERYPTAQELADDLTRWLEGRPVKARPPSAGQKLRRTRRRWGRRHAAVLTVAAAAVMLLLAVTVVLQARHFAAQREEQKQTEAASAAAEENFTDALRVVEAMLDRTSDELTTVPHTERV